MFLFILALLFPKVRGHQIPSKDSGVLFTSFPSNALFSMPLLIQAEQIHESTQTPPEGLFKRENFRCSFLKGLMEVRQVLGQPGRIFLGDRRSFTGTPSARREMVEQRYELIGIATQDRLENCLISRIDLKVKE
ncbi:MAG: hypothetical protein C4576_28830 [Desulfobacteraceae bacterium]|nr:MAG: hypothetical protein C4576_28830 [Desulfobacteraceae bacterium]